MNYAIIDLLGFIDRTKDENEGIDRKITLFISPLGKLDPNLDDVLKVKILCSRHNYGLVNLGHEGLYNDKYFAIALNDCLDLINVCKEKDPETLVVLDLDLQHFINFDSSVPFLQKLGVKNIDWIREENAERKKYNSFNQQDQIVNLVYKIHKSLESIDKVHTKIYGFLEKLIRKSRYVR